MVRWWLMGSTHALIDPTVSEKTYLLSVFFPVTTLSFISRSLKKKKTYLEGVLSYVWFSLVDYVYTRVKFSFPVFDEIDILLLYRTCSVRRIGA